MQLHRASLCECADLELEGDSGGRRKKWKGSVVAFPIEYIALLNSILKISLVRLRVSCTCWFRCKLEFWTYDMGFLASQYRVRIIVIASG